jgi:Uncharacterised protein family (UPF0175)
MQLTIEIPDELAAALASGGADPARTAFEAIVLEAYRERRIGSLQLRTFLGIPSRYELDGFLKAHRIEKYTAEDFEHDLAAMRAPGAGESPKRNA